MKPEEAKKYLQNFVGDGLMEFVIGPMKTESLISAIEALDKQVPKKPEYDGRTFSCPNCDCWISGDKRQAKWMK